MKVFHYRHAATVLKAAFFVLLLVAALGPSAPAAELSAGQRDAITKHLNDPESARFRSVRQSPKFPKVLCGEVNWRNAQGGYGGYQKFWLDGDGKSAIAPSGPYEAWASGLGCE